MKRCRDFVFLAFLVVPFAGYAQPSGGPYGPVQQTYELPEAETIYHVSPGGDADATGADPDQPTTLEVAIRRAGSGDAIILRGGIYRTGNLRFNQGITLQPYEDERPVLNGTRVATEWTELDNGLWRTKWETLFPAEPQDWWRRHRHGHETPLYLFNNDMVFIDGELLKTVGWEGELDEDSFFIDYKNGHVYIGADPTGHTVEITAFDNALTRVIGEVHGRPSDGIGPTIRGIKFTQYAYRAIEIEGTNPQGVSDESKHGKAVVGTTIEHCTLSFCSRVGAYIRGDDLTFRHCLVSDTGTEGIFILSSSDALLEKNIFRRNNIEEITGYYPAAVKIFNQCYRVVCRDNLVIDHPHSNGIWYDVGNVDGVFVNNWIVRTDNGFFFEISNGAICAGNVFVDCPTGIYVLNSQNVEVYQNTLVNSPAKFERTSRSAVNDHFGWHPRTGPGLDERDGHVFFNNLVTANAGVERPLLQVLQEPSLCGQLTTPQLKELNHNVYVRRSIQPRPLVRWSGIESEDDCAAEFTTLATFREAVPSVGENSRYFAGYAGPLFHGAELGRFELMPGFPGTKAAGSLPANVEELLGPAYADADFPGAFPVRDDRSN